MADNNIFSSYDEYMKNIFDCVNRCLSVYLENMKTTFSNGQGGYKNVLYPDLEIAADAAAQHVIRFDREFNSEYDFDDEEDEDQEDEDGEEYDKYDYDDYNDEELLAAFGVFGTYNGDFDNQKSIEEDINVTERLIEIQEKARLTVEAGIDMPFYNLCQKWNLTHLLFSVLPVEFFHQHRQTIQEYFRL